MRFFCQDHDNPVYQPPVSSLSDEEVAHMLEFEALCEAEYQFCCNVADFFEGMAYGIASSLAKRSCRCGMTICPSCGHCHSIHCEKGVLMGLECDEALRELSMLYYSCSSS